MKGIILISNDEKSGPFIDIQYPSLLCDVEEIIPSELIKFYEEQNDNMVGPSYFETKLKNGVILAFFYTGFSSAHYVGKPAHAVLVLLSEEETNSENLEGMMRRIAHELLPQRDEAVFHALFQDYYDLLKNGELGPFWEEVGEKQEHGIRESIEIKSIVDNGKIQDEKGEFEDNSEINSLKKQIKEQEEKFETWSEELTSLNENNANLMNKIKTLKEESDKQIKIIENQEKEIQSLNQSLEEKKKEIEELEQQIEDKNELQIIADKSNELTKEIEVKDEEINKLRENLEEMVKTKEEIDLRSKEIESIKLENENLRNDFLFAEEEIGRLKTENERFLNTFTNLKLEIKQTKEQLENENKDNEKLKDEIIDMKKEVKVLRRERDHYKNIVKEKNLL